MSAIAGWVDFGGDLREQGPVVRAMAATMSGRGPDGDGLHAQLREPLRESYRAVERLEPGRVVWELPGSGVPADVEPRRDRCDPTLLDAFVGLLRSP